MLAVGLELGTNVVKLAVVEAVRGGHQVRDFEVHRLDAKKGDLEDDVVTTVKEALKRLRAPKDALAVSVRALDCMIREIQVPFVEEGKIRATIKYQAENYFTSTSIDDLIIDYSKFSETDGKSKLMVAGIKKPLVDRRLRFLEECGVDPVAVDLDVAALFNACAHLGMFDDKGAALLVEVEADTLKVGVIEEGRLRLARAIRMRVGQMNIQRRGGGRGKGGESGVYDTAADESARLPVVILDEGDDEAFSLEDSAISETEREGIIHRIFMEIDRTVASVHLSHEVEHIYLAGASCALEGIETTFSDHFEIPATRLDLSSHLNFEEGSPGKGRPSLSLQGGTAVGLALKALGIDHCGMDFRQEEFAYQGTFEIIKRGLAATLSLLFAFVFLYAFSLRQRVRERNDLVLGVQTMERSLYTVLFPSLDDPSRDHQPLRVGGSDSTLYYESLKAEIERLRGKFQGSAESGPQVSALEVLEHFCQAKSRVRPDLTVTVTKIRVDPRQSGKSSFTCLANHPGAGSELERALSEDKLVKGTAQSAQLDQKTGKWLINLIVELREEKS